MAKDFDKSVKSQMNKFHDDLSKNKDFNIERMEKRIHSHIIDWKNNVKENLKNLKERQTKEFYKGVKKVQDEKKELNDLLNKFKDSKSHRDFKDELAQSQEELNKMTGGIAPETVDKFKETIGLNKGGKLH